MTTDRTAEIIGGLTASAIALGLLWGMPLAGLATFAQWRGGAILSASGPEAPSALAAFAASAALSLLIGGAAAAASSAVVLLRGPTSRGWQAVRSSSALVAAAAAVLIGIAMVLGALTSDLDRSALLPASAWLVLASGVAVVLGRALQLRGPTSVRAAAAAVLLLPTIGALSLIIW